MANRVVIITGAGGGLGAAYAKELASRGARVVVNDPGGAVDGSGVSWAAQGVTEQILAAGGEAVACYGDITTVEGRDDIVSTAMSAYGQIDGLVCNAGILRDKAFHKMSADQIDAVLDVHLRGHIHLAQKVFAIMREAEFGRIVFVTSASGLYGNFGQANYGAAKAGLFGLTKVLAIEGAQKGILVNAVAPIAATRMTAGVLADEVTALAAPEAVSQMVAVLASDQCPVTGNVYSVCGSRVAEIFIAETEGVIFDDIRAESILDLLGLVGLRENYVEPDSLTDAVEIILHDLRAAAANM
jgi:NAD(P)-dependent dehydrogenase (short-subunit alcohol dehydrogenase family)